MSQDEKEIQIDEALNKLMLSKGVNLAIKGFKYYLDDNIFLYVTYNSWSIFLTLSVKANGFSQRLSISDLTELLIKEGRFCDFKNEVLLKYVKCVL